MTTRDVLIAIPAIPFFALFITWWLPWESWISRSGLPKLILGPYLLYGAFAVWYFHFSPWFVVFVAIIGSGVTIVGAYEHATQTLTSTTHRRFLRSLKEWLRDESEIMILVEYSRSAGNKSFEFFTEFAALKHRLKMLKAETRVTAFRKRQLALRGCVDDEFIGKCLSSMPAGSEFLVIETDPRLATQQWLYHHKAGESADELRSVLEGWRGRLVAAGIYPSTLTDGPDVITAYVPHRDGSVKAGIY